MILVRPRPTIAPLLHATGWSLPSNHALAAFAGATIIAQALPHRRAVIFCIAALIALTRVYSGVHFLSDVLIGAGLGILVGTLIVRAQD